MAQTEMPQKIEHLKRFLITRLLLVMLFILISESLINLLTGQIVFPMLNTFFRKELFLEQQSPGANAWLLSRLAAFFILKEMGMILPGSASGFFSYLSDSVWKNSELFREISGPQQILILLVLLIFLCIYLIPYLAGVLYYSSIVVKKM